MGRAEFLHLRTTDIWTRPFFASGDWPVHCGMFVGVPDHLLDASNAPPSHDNQLISRHCQMSPEGGKVAPGSGPPAQSLPVWAFIAKEWMVLLTSWGDLGPPDFLNTYDFVLPIEKY